MKRNTLNEVHLVVTLTPRLYNRLLELAERSAVTTGASPMTKVRSYAYEVLEAHLVERMEKKP